MDPNSATNLESHRLLSIATTLLHASDLPGAKSFAERALESDPLLPGVDQILAVADVLLASQPHQPNYYSILLLPSPSPSLSINRNFRHLSLLLSPSHNNLPHADSALRSVLHAYSFLSDPANKSRYDSHLPGQPLFWTSCPSCRHVFEYDRVYVDRTLRCKVCLNAFRAGEMMAAPNIVPGTDMYYCAWGFFPLGFPGSGFENGWKETAPLNAVPVNVKRGGAVRNRKVVAKKRMGSCVKTRDLFGEDSEVEEVETGGGREGAGAGAGEEGEGVGNFEIDLEATEDLLSNLHDLPFV